MKSMIGIAVAILFLSACSSAPRIAEPEIATDKISPEMSLQRAAYRLIERMNTGDKAAILENYIPQKKTNGKGPRTTASRTYQLSESKTRTIKRGFENTLEHTFLEHNISLVALDYDKRSITLRSNSQPLYPFLLRFDMGRDKNSGFYIADVWDVSADFSLNQTYASSIDYIDRFKPEIKASSAEEVRRRFVSHVNQKLIKPGVLTRELPPHTVYAAFQLAIALDSLTKAQAKTMVDYIAKHRPSSRAGFQLQIDLYFENSNAEQLLATIEKMKPRLLTLDPVGYSLAESMVELKRGRYKAAARASRIAIEKEPINPWPYVITRKIAQRTKNRALLNTVNQTIKANFYTDLKELDAIF
ncbi:MAG: hypothetical protein ACPGSC_15420 [Granulosicoccaceae bacterium]